MNITAGPFLFPRLLRARHGSAP